ncbi:hypothetical protein GCM10009639_29170 [Kitasatospora putterlickiae]|uniref:Transcriptional regulator n=1 Tax=Kitasatospora putterlickiae TaxID=221725 RepID=A0ABN1Y0Q6_9ACTN
MGDLPGAVAALTASLRCRPAAERRARAVTTVRMAGLLLSQGRLDRSCAAWHAVLDDHPLLGSGRVDAAVRRLRGTLAGHAASPAARSVLARIDAPEADERWRHP